MVTSRGNFSLALADTAARTPDAPAIVEAGTTTDYAGLASAAGAIAHSLATAGLQPGDRVGIFQQRGLHAAASFFGVMAAGGIAVNVNETLRRRQVDYVLDHSGARLLLAFPDFVTRSLGSLERDIEIIDPGTAEPSPLQPVARVWADPAHIIYTSGSTGMPKGVAVSHGNLWAGTESVAEYVELRADDRLASLLPFSFDYGLNQLLGAVLTGAALVVDRSPIPQRIVRALQQQEVTVLAAVAPLWLRLLDVGGFEDTELPHLRAMTNTGSRLPKEAVSRIRKAHPQTKLFLMYGLTEAFRSTRLDPDLVDSKPESIGRAIPGAQILLVDEDGRSVPDGETGELVHRGPTVALGYWADPAATASRFRPPPAQPDGVPDSERAVFSGDLVRRDADGDLYFVGRRDGLIKTSGYRVSPDEVAEALYASGSIAEAVVFGEPDDVLGSRIVAAVVLRDGSDVEQAWDFVRAELPPYMQPQRIDVRTELPRTASGKFASPTASAT